MMRTWGRINGIWNEVTTDQNGYNDAVYLTTLCQVLRLNLGESPVYANYGIPAQQSVVTQVFPDYYAMITQGQFASAFPSLTIQRTPNTSPPTYAVNMTAHTGAILPALVPV
jgi:hypothetical protein